jgi:predicted dehydrogenase
MGQGHLRCFLGYPEAQVLAVCDVDRWRRENAKKNVETAYAEQRSSGRYRGCGAYTDLRDLLARREIDAVLIATGDRWHVPAAVLAARAGKDIYCEKPMSLTINEARAMVDVTRRCGRVFQTGLQQRSTPDFQIACRLVRQGRIGRVKHVYVSFPGTAHFVDLPAEPVPEGLDWNLWIGPAPWRPYNRRLHPYGRPPHVIPWYFCREFSGGNLTSNAVHNFDTVQWGLGMDHGGPVEIIPPETGKVPSLTYKYPGDIVLQVEWQLSPGKHFIPEGWDPATKIQNFGALFIGTDGWIHVGRHGYMESHPREILEEIAPLRPGQVRPVPDHHHNWLECIRTRARPVCDVSRGCRSTTVAHLGCIAHWTGRALKWDPVREEFVGDDAANRMRSRAKREPWRL